MKYRSLPEVGASGAPPLPWHPSPNRSSRNGRAVRLVFVHVWGGGTFEGVLSWLTEPRSQASAHVVYAGEQGRDAGRIAQLVSFSEKAWTECDLNPVGVSVESADAIWRGDDAHGFARLARMVALLCHCHTGDICRPVAAAGVASGSYGFCRHADAGALGCGHLSCPTPDLELWRQFSERVVAEHRHGRFRDAWGRT